MFQPNYINQQFLPQFLPGTFFFYMKIDIKRRHFEIEIDRESFLALNAYAKKVKKPIKALASSILKEKLVS
jgi:hypothetical protein